MKENAPISEIKETLKNNLDVHNTTVTFHQVWNKAHDKRENKRTRITIALGVFVLLFLTFSMINKLSFKNLFNDSSDSSSVHEMADTVQNSTMAYLLMNGNEYVFQGHVETNKFTIKEQLGVVQKAIRGEAVLKDNFSSNILNVGDKIYSTNENTKVLIVEQMDGTKLKFLEK
ncbi:hypothetical protein CN692_13485 [Bacillus sp. AFS002410]|uniref:hypothetical protein n=1 Tax=Bacillus sp. AFS002410 TaxID=2033481 RepID=UPI000BF1AC21|nr:hypothetical protein [Bacillus sp. AFS002410]PEJ57160.1 hypothetical protein CN692_13485 [Bacillus sp. AFS002410]